jgi:hypothetical protein
MDEIPDAMIAKMLATGQGTAEVSTSESGVQEADDRKIAQKLTGYSGCF